MATDYVIKVRCRLGGTVEEPNFSVEPVTVIRLLPEDSTMMDYEPDDELTKEMHAATMKWLERKHGEQEGAALWERIDAIAERDMEQIKKGERHGLVISSAQDVTDIAKGLVELEREIKGG